MIEASSLRQFVEWLLESLSCAENREAVLANFLLVTNEGAQYNHHPAKKTTTRGTDSTARCRLRGRKTGQPLRPLLLSYCRFSSLFQPNYVGIICVNFSPKTLIERKAEIAR